MKVIIIILQAILNLVRKRRDLIANRSKIPPEYRDDVVVWYSPKKQRLTNYDVIESYAEDFTKGNIYNENGEISIDNEKQLTITNIINVRRGLYNIVVKNVNPDFIIYVKGMVSDGYLRAGGALKIGGYSFIDLHNGINKIDVSNFVIFIIEGNIAGDCNITITQLPTSILKDYSGNELDAYMYGFQGKLNSGVGIYQQDFTNTRNATTVSSDGFEVTKKAGTYLARISIGYWNNKECKLLFETNNTTRFYYIRYRKANNDIVATVRLYNGENIIPAQDNLTDVSEVIFEGILKDNEYIRVTEIPDYPNSLCYAGKQYCQAYNVPKFTDYTIITRRAILSLNGSFGLISKRIIPANIGAFILEKDNNVTGAKPNTLRAFTFGVSTPVNPNLDYSIIYQTKIKYKEQDLTVGSIGDSDVFLIGAGLYNEAINGVGEFITAVHDDIIILKRSLTINEINDITEAIFNETIIEEQTNNTP